MANLAATAQFSSADLILLPGARVYHLNVGSAELASDIILVGDPERVPLIAERFLESVECDVSHRGLRTVTGRVRASGLRVSVITSGMGPPSLEIVLQEIVALTEIDLVRRERRATFPVLQVIRVGTSGALRASTPLGTSIISRYALGLDNTGLFYDAVPADQTCKKIEDSVRNMLDLITPKAGRFAGRIWPYASKANELLADALLAAATEHHLPVSQGVTVSSAGFFGNQGRDISRVPLTLPEIDRHLSELDPGLGGLRFENMEMESSFLFHFMGALGHRAATICPVVANRYLETFVGDYSSLIEGAAQVALDALARVRRSQGQD